MTSRTSRRLDLVVFGATSFVGQILCRHLVDRHGTQGPLRWAIAGRNAAKLDQVALATGAPTAGRDVSMAKALASDAARLAVRNSLQCHGAIGYTVEYDLHLYLKRAEALSRTWGDAAWHRRRVAVALGI